MASALLDIDVCPNGDAMLLVLRGEIDLVSVESLRACLEEIDPKWHTLAVDMAGVSFIDSAGISALVEVHQRLQPDGVLEVWRPSERVRTVLEITGVGELFKVI